MFEAPSVSIGGSRHGEVRSDLECLVLVAKTHGVNLNVAQLVADNSLRDGPLSGKDLARCARKAGLRAEVVNFTWRDLRKAKRRLPAIVALKSGARMVLVGFEKGGAPVAFAQLQDPSAEDGGLLTIDQPRFEEAYTGESILISRRYALTDEEQPFSVGLVKALVYRERRLVRDIVICAMILSLIAITPIIFWRLLMDRVLQNSQNATSMNTFVVLCVGMAIFVAFETIFSYFRSYLTLIVSTRIDLRIWEYTYDKLLRLPIDYFERTPAGMIGHAVHEARKVREFISEQVFGTVLDSLTILVFLPVMYLFSPLLTAIVVGCCVLIVLWLIWMLPDNRRAAGAVTAAESMRGAFLYQNLQGMRTVKTLALETRQRRGWDLHTGEVARLRLKQGFVMAFVDAGVRPLERLAVMGALAVGVYFAITTNDPVYIGALFAFYILSGRVAAPLARLAHLVNQFDEARAATGMVGSVVNQPKEDMANDRGIRTPIEGLVEFVNVRFKYQSATSYALDGVNFAVPIGQTLGVVGRSGSGKTTLTRMLQRLHTDYEGSVEIDGVDVRLYDVAHLRRSVGVVLQENFLFTGSIRDNIAIAKPHATFEEVVRAARLGGAEEFIDRLPRGYETHIYEGSPNLSGGQKQRLAIARALIVDPRILILDEATSALDPDSESIVNDNIRRIAQGRTVIVISHRISSLVNSDAILVMERGAVVDVGKHHELLERCEIYASLWNQQNRHIAAASRPAALRGPTRVS